eukprot:CAMPEP_0203860030 /NCGR_PEP_ID=MMETSP0359-20131031/12196_1 /ASSEMBLY_ACC=CAM_ASM_000338 /TAXON_ID=268821 /ORGANISM="Scrippsiella Hangoei, Strain SHTV-5" /LENGTH=268 /DNA_ID=CAMNT_0050777043 /DNA_START=169 /DNA_END=975 /DNA_ORIENTATION=-
MQSTLRTHEQDKSQALQAAEVCESEDGTRSVHMEPMDSMRTLQDRCRDKWQARGVERTFAMKGSFRSEQTSSAAVVTSCPTADAEATLPETDTDPQLIGLELGCLTGQEDGAAAEESGKRKQPDHDADIPKGSNVAQATCKAAKPASTEKMGVGKHNQASSSATASANSATNAKPEADATSMFFKGASPTSALQGQSGTSVLTSLSARSQGTSTGTEVLASLSPRCQSEPRPALSMGSLLRVVSDIVGADSRGGELSADVAVSWGKMA